MAKLGSTKRPAVVRVQSEARAAEIIALCTKSGWQVIAGIEPDQPEDVSDLNKLLGRPSPVPDGGTARFRPISGNDYCPCGSGKKFKKCCGPAAKINQN